MLALLAALPPPGKDRLAQLVKIEVAVQTRDSYRLQKVAEKHGISKPLPLGGLQAQLAADLTALPIDITSKADELANFVAASQNPLGAASSIASSSAAAVQQAAGASASEAKEVVVNVAKHSRAQPSPRTEINWGGNVPVRMYSPGLHGAMDPSSETPAAKEDVMQPAPKMKDLFKLAQRGDFEILSKFTASVAGPGPVLEQMRKTVTLRMHQGFGVSQRDAMKATEMLIPALYEVVRETKIHDHRPPIKISFFRSSCQEPVCSRTKS